MRERYKFILSSFILVILLNGCTTVIGGNESTAKTSGNVGPATIADGDVNLENDKISNVTVLGNFTGKNLTITENLNVKISANLTKLNIKNQTLIGGNLVALSCTFKNLSKIGGNVISTDSYFGNALEFGGTNLLLSQKSKVVGNIISSNQNPVTIIIDKSTVDGNIGFANLKGIVILRNHGTLKGRLINGTLQKE